MSPVLAALAVACLAAVAAAGVASGFRRRDPVPIEAPADPLEDRRLALLRSLADLDEARAIGALEEAQHARLRRETEGRMAHLLRAMDARSNPSRRGATVRDRRREPSAVEEAEAEGGVVRVGTAGRVPPWAVALLLVATVASVVVTGVLRDSEPAPAPATQGISGDDPFAFFEERVERQPDDVAARLDLAHRYLDAGRVDEALAEYAVILDLDPDDAEALAHVGLILYQSGRPQRALDTVDRALETAPGYPEALFFRGVILLRGLERPAEAIEAFEAYLEAAPFGLERSTSRMLIAEAEDAMAERTP